MPEDPKDDSRAYNEKVRDDFVAQFDAHYPQNTEPVSREHIGGLESIIAELDRYKRGIEHSTLYEIMGARPPKGFLLVGPPGVGKSYLAKYLSQHVGARFVDLPLSQFESKWVGEAEKKLEAHIENFQNYYKLTGKPVLVFFDEAEEVFKNRSDQGWHGPRVNVLLRCMDGLGRSVGVLFGAATNHLEKIDPAILRPGRLDFILKIPQYDARMLGDVYRAQRDWRNSRSLGSYEPYKLSPEDCSYLGVKSFEKSMTPADVAEVYRRAVEEKVRSIVEDSHPTVLPRESYHVYRDDLERIVDSYSRGDGKSKRRIGF